MEKSSGDDMCRMKGRVMGEVGFDGNKNTKCQRLNDIRMIDFIPCLLFLLSVSPHQLQGYRMPGEEKERAQHVKVKNSLGLDFFAFNL